MTPNPTGARWVVNDLVLAVHAIRAIPPGREALGAAGFGLVHGRALATTIAGCGIDPWHTVLGFNVGRWPCWPSGACASCRPSSRS